ncbi:IS3 family transposase [Porticoccus sp. W117]|uniref:IS3 family transposase n=1 Tax=Porticoccus sp. W117 TaxID=3054777 RepID=UPI00259480E8|nr:IS3 family transposase [Porticoccus sp. W117]MDM3871056.1 IS3 family transposase [Porticoccus sp. W117]
MIKRRKFSDAFKADAIQLVLEQDYTPKEAASSLGVTPDILRRWIRQAEARKQGSIETGEEPLLESERTELLRLRRENKRLEMEREILKKATAFFGQRVELRYGFIAQQKKAYPVAVLCRVMQVSRSGFYSYLKRPPSPQEGGSELERDVRRVFDESGQTYGSRRLLKALKTLGYRIGRYAVRSLMRRLGLVVRHKLRFRVTTNSRHGMPVASNVLNRAFDVKEANRVWGSDITYIWTDEGWLYLAVVIDLYSRKVVGWSMEHRMGSSLAVRALRLACQTRQPSPGLIHHSDRGVQYASQPYQQVLDEWQMVGSMSRKGDCWDNAVVERFFRSLKVERVSRARYRTRAAAKADILDYIVMFYNSRRLHSYLGYQSPNVYEATAFRKAA